ncbi:hypothetical protein Acr_14g0007650 [Actinidia rufa]|uniref:DC1 domain-containing protein n=1 Tax=Actinidia rufa TaxID=165716 RepID=A0A7J0FSG0_9ERIC|nr:hypothetical protein Acr_14g0007650 [Actinidia rufa]
MEIQHFSHNHPLILHEGDLKAAVKCSGCELSISSTPSYGCTKKCFFFIHKSCAEMPQELDKVHIFHPIPTHHLTLLPRPPLNLPTFKCYACEKTRRGFTYHCPTCEVSLCVNCILLVPLDDYDDYRQIRLPKHEHPFILCTKDKKFDISCIDCKHPIEDESLYLCPYEDDDAEFYCDACEKRRNLNDRSYSCAEPGCRFVAYIHCLITEILCFLEEESSFNISQVVKEQQDEEVISSVVEESSLVTSESNRIEVPGNLNIAELDDEIEKLRIEIEALTAKLGAFERRRAHLASSTI